MKHEQETLVEYSNRSANKTRIHGRELHMRPVNVNIGMKRHLLSQYFTGMVEVAKDSRAWEHIVSCHPRFNAAMKNCTNERRA